MTSDNHVTGLKPCPFCGNDEITFYVVEDMLAADCRDCGAHGPIILDGKAVTKPSVAGDAWNTRQPPTSEQASVHSPDDVRERVARAIAERVSNASPENRMSVTPAKDEESHAATQDKEQ